MVQPSVITHQNPGDWLGPGPGLDGTEGGMTGTSEAGAAGVILTVSGFDRCHTHSTARTGLAPRARVGASP